jgi:hypothetical protein
VTFHETFWVVTGTAAPVIALAAIVSVKGLISDSNAITDPAAAHLGDTGVTGQLQEDLTRYLSHWTNVSSIPIFGQWVNVGLQALVLTFSLLSIAYHRDELLVWIAIAVTVAGMLWLAVADVVMMMAKEFAQNQLDEITAAIPSASRASSGTPSPGTARGEGNYSP